MLGDNVADSELLRTLQVQYRKYIALYNDAVNQKATAAVIASLARQRDHIKMQINDVSARLAQADQPSSGLVRLEEGATQLGKVFAFGGGIILPLALIAAAFWFKGKAGK